MSRAIRTATLWLWGGFLYYAIEVVWRGYSHPAMFAVGGICFLLIGGINNWFPWTMGLVWQALIGAAAVTATELASGILLNRWLGLGIWDYSRMPLNFLGQICLPFSAAWAALSLFGIWLDDYLRWKLYGEQKPQYKLI
ncbi:MAG: putative ABC transporter permease [Clostridium sp.]|jgi:uncharacterized membrane protein|nr:putative ABC transporter permease [Clostridium sp.]